MTYYTKKAIVFILTQIIIFISFFPQVISKASSLDTMSPLFLTTWATFFLVLLVANIVIKIIVYIIFNIILNMTTKEKQPSIIDERDQLIELKAIRNLCFAFVMGFFISMISLVFNQSLNTMFSILAYSFLLSGIALEASYISYYQSEA